MKKAIVSFSFLLFTVTTYAQEHFGLNFKPSELPKKPCWLSESENNKLAQYSRYIAASKKGAAKTTAYSASTWYDMAAQHSLFPPTTGYYMAVYPDSNVLDAGGTPPYNIYTHGLGVSFDPMDSAYSWGTTCYYPILPHIVSGINFTFDSFRIPIQYMRHNPLTTVVDSIILEFAVASNPVNSSANDSGAYNLQFLYSPAMTPYTADGRPRFSSIHYNSGCGMMPAPYNADPYINDCYFDSVFVPKYRIAIPLTSASVADTDANGYLNLCHIYTGGGGNALPISPAFSINTGYQHLVYYAAFKSGVSYPLGTLSTAANYLKMFMADFSTLAAMQSVGSFQSGLIATDLIRYNDTGWTFPNHVHDVLIPLSTFGIGGMGSQFPCAGFHLNYTVPVTLALNFYYDDNLNCIKDIGESSVWQPLTVEVDSAGIAIDTISATSGLNYYAYGPVGTVYAFKVFAPPTGLYASCPLSGIIYDTITTVYTPPAKDIAFFCTTTPSFDLSINAVISGTGAYSQCGYIYVQNPYCNPVTTTVTVHYSNNYDGYLMDVSPMATTISANTVIWNLGPLSGSLPGPVTLHYKATIATAPFTLGDTVHSDFDVSPVTGDLNPGNNVQANIDTVTSSYDPNEMWVTPSCIKSGDTAVLLKYTINFENTGHDTAHHIYVLDTLSDNVDIGSMRLLMCSHQMYTSHLKDPAGHRILKFDFPSINLLDSTHHGKCDGAIIYTIKTKPGLVSGTHIYNKAGIYFDGNSVIMTNKVDNVIGCITGVPVVQNENRVEIFPNPATEEFVIKTGKDVYNSCTITNSMGQVMIELPMSNQIQVNAKMLPVGLYYVILKGDHGSLVRKVVKL